MKYTLIAMLIAGCATSKISIVEEELLADGNTWKVMVEGTYINNQKKLDEHLESRGKQLCVEVDRIFGCVGTKTNKLSKELGTSSKKFCYIKCKS